MRDTYAFVFNMHSWFKAKLGVFKKIRKTYEYFTNTDQQWIVFFAAPFIQKITVLVVVVVFTTKEKRHISKKETAASSFFLLVLISWMVTLSSCFILPPIVYALEQHWDLSTKLILILAGKITVLVVVVVFTTIGKRHTSKKVPVMKYFTVVP